jgi:type II secretory ATPase GspE/PulE/Tfp pilus assembly ATPase PilB-like protein
VLSNYRESIRNVDVNEDKRVSRGQSISTINAVPSGFRLSDMFYRGGAKSFSMGDPVNSRVIPLNLRRKVFVGRSIKAADPEHLFYYYDDGSTKDFIRKFLVYYKRLNEPELERIKIIQVDNLKVMDELASIHSQQLENLSSTSEQISTEGNELVLEVEQVLYKAMNLKASDFHLESLNGKDALIRFRVNKELFDFRKIPHKKAIEIGNVFFGHFIADKAQERGSGDGMYKHDTLLEGEFSRKIDDVDMKARMVNMGTNHADGFNLVLRLIDKKKSNDPTSFEAMGFSNNSCSLLKEVEDSSRGFILTGGVTGSGKSTTQQNQMQLERDRSGRTRKIYSFEQPVEQVIEGVIQCSVKDGDENTPDDRNYSFENYNKLSMRGDPDTIAYGEIRDHTTAMAADKGARSGHLVYGTMHVYDVMGIFPRFESFGLPPEKVCDPGYIRMAMFQHLLPKLCPHCSRSYRIGSEMPERYDEYFISRSYRDDSNSAIDPEVLRDTNGALKSGESLFRMLQKRGEIRSSDVVAMKRKLQLANGRYDKNAFRERLERVTTMSGAHPDDVNIKFRGTGCHHCLNGHVGVTPAAEVLVPDEEFLNLVRKGEMHQARMYWLSDLGGRSATEDSYEKIIQGIVDPRIVEDELEKIGS